jgi:hypothetical protein
MEMVDFQLFVDETLYFQYSERFLAICRAMRAAPPLTVGAAPIA